MTDDARTSTAELLTRLQASEPDVGLRLYDRFADRIHDFVLFVTRDGSLAAQTTQEVIVTTARQAPSRLAEPADLRTWLYARARDEIFAVLSARGRTPPEDRVVDVPGLPEAPTTADLGGLVWAAMGAFSERDQALIALHLRHGMSGDALAQAMGLSAGAVDVLLGPTLERVESQLCALLVLATGTATSCTELDALRDQWDGMFSPLVRVRATQLLAACAGWSSDLPAPLTLLQAVPLVPAPASLRDAVAEQLAMTSALARASAASQVSPDDHTIPPPPPAGSDDDVTVPPPVRHLPVPATGPVEDPPTTTGELAARRPAKLPLPLAIALGIAVGLVIAAGVLRYAGGEAVVQVPSTPPAASEVAGPVADPLEAAATAAIEPVEPGRLAVTADEVVVDPEGSALRLTNSGGTPVVWSVTGAPGWLRLGSRDGIVEPGATVEVAVEMAEGLPEGDYADVVTIDWDGARPGVARISVVGAVERRPELQNLQVGARDLVVAGCGGLDRTEMAVAVSDEHPIESVTVTVTGPGADSQSQFELLPDATRDGRFVGVVGPFEQPGTRTVTLGAVDARGNRAEASGGDLVVVPC